MDVKKLVLKGFKNACLGFLAPDSKQAEKQKNQKTKQGKGNNAKARDFADLQEFFWRRFFADDGNALGGFHKTADFFIQVH